MTVESWTNYWKTGVLHSCASASREVVFSHSFWYRIFSELKMPATIVDVGTGNGLIPLLAKSALGPEREATIYGVDIADIDPLRTLGQGFDFSGVEFIGGVSAERMPFSDSSVDLITAQFGFEYTELERSTLEVSRLLRSGGAAALVMHSDRSRIFYVSQQQLVDIEWLQAKGFLHAAQDMAYVLCQRSRGSLSNGNEDEVIRGRYNDMAQSLLSRLAMQNSGDVLARTAASIQRALRRAAAQQADEHEFERIERGLCDEAARLRDLIGAALSDEKLAELKLSMERLGFKVEVEELLDEDGSLMAHGVRAKRR